MMLGMTDYISCQPTLLMLLQAQTRQDPLIPAYFAHSTERKQETYSSILLQMLHSLLVWTMIVKNLFSFGMETKSQNVLKVGCSCTFAFVCAFALLT